MESTAFSSEEYVAVTKETMDTVLKLGKLKGGEYSGDDDRLLNFRRGGRNFAVPAELIMMVYAGKHWDALMQYTQDVVHGTSRERLEGIEGRIDDLINYLILFKCLYRERCRLVKL